MKVQSNDYLPGPDETKDRWYSLIAEDIVQMSRSRNSLLISPEEKEARNQLS